MFVLTFFISNLDSFYLLRFYLCIAASYGFWDIFSELFLRKKGLEEEDLSGELTKFYMA